MKKIITLTLSLLIVSIGFSQNAPIDFETGGNGATWTWTTFENATNPAVEIVNNPSSVAPNTSAKVAKFTALQAGQPWAGCESQKTVDLGTFTLSASNATVKIMVYKPAISDVGIKFIRADNGSTGEIKVANTKINEWEELTFNFAPLIGNPQMTDIVQIAIFPDFNLAGRGADNICYFDNIRFTSGSALAEPTAAATTPTKPAADVISLFSNAYTNVPVDTWRTSWSQGTLTDIQVATDDVKRYSGLDFVGIEMVANQLDIDSMEMFEFDLWTPNSTSFRFKVVDFGANGAFGGGDDVEHETIITPTLNGWNHVAVPIASMTGLVTKSNIAQLIFASSPAGSSVVYIDNVMFSKNAVVAEPTVAAPTPTKAAANVISLFSNAYTNVPVDTWRTSWSAATLTETQVAGNDVKKYTGLDFVGIEMVANQLDITTMDTFEFDVWTPNSTSFRTKLVDFGADSAFAGGDDVEHEVTITPTLNGWNHVTVAVSAMTGLTTKSNIAQLIFASSPAGSSTAYIDNVLFSKNPTTSVKSSTKELVGIYPNPTSNVLYIQTASNVQNITIYNALGQVVLASEPNSNNVNLNIMSLPMGIYTVKVGINGNDTFTKIIKE
ncbi:MAG: T9SS type A sorting domain-containing protein [Bacteroidia bacterium]|jgi:hypothetical protein|nr:T9SS type A sorting domain-containing protein [Bacteroidia bacterium]